MKLKVPTRICFLLIGLFGSFAFQAKSDAIFLKATDHRSHPTMEFVAQMAGLLSGEIVYDGNTLAVNSAQIFDFETNNISTRQIIQKGFKSVKDK